MLFYTLSENTFQVFLLVIFNYVVFLFRDKSVCNKHLVNVCVMLFIESKEDNVVTFIQEFQKLIVSDNKVCILWWNWFYANELCQGSWQ